LYRLPRQPTSFVGREGEVAAVSDLLVRGPVRVLTLLGPPGIGKTRLALAVADAGRSEFGAGAVFVDLSPVRDPEVVPHAIAHGLGVTAASTTPVLHRLITFLQGWHLLLVLDNFEQVVEARATVADLVEAAEGLHVLVTSREPLHLSWEHQFPVPPLEIPPLSPFPPLDALARYASVALFVDRAQAAQPDFSLTRENARAVAEICERLDGLPLPIEMAAVRVKTLTPEAIARRLDRQMALLAAGVRDVPERHRTMRAAIGWSYEMLDDGQRALFRKLSVFAGGCRLEAGQAVCGDAGEEEAVFLDRLSSLLDRSLSQRKAGADGTPRFWMLESLREFGLEQLEAAGEHASTGARHAAFYVRLAEQAEPELHRRDQQRWAARLEAERGNFRAALTWLLDSGDVESAARLAAALHWFWFLQGDIFEGRGWLERILTSRRGLSRGALGRALTASGMLAWSQGDDGSAQPLLAEAVDLLRGIGARQDLAYALHFWGHTAGRQGDHRAAAAAFEESAALYRQVHDDWGTAFSLNCLALPTFRLGEHERAIEVFQDSQARLRRIGDRHMLGRSLHMLADVLAERGEFTRAAVLLEESIAFYREYGDRWGLLRSLQVLTSLALRQGRFREALPTCKEALVCAKDLGVTDVATWSLVALARVAAALGQEERAVRLLGASEALRHTDLPPLLRTLKEQTEEAARRALGDVRFEAVQRAGQLLMLEEAVDDALSLEPPQDDAAPRGPGGALSPREWEVAALVAQGLSNREIGRALFIGRRTVDTHIESILNKLGFSRRAEIAAWIGREGIAAQSPAEAPPGG
jgi:non-specific serine/threonine protein kinase